MLKDPRIDLSQDWLRQYELEPYFFCKAIRLGYKVKEVPVTKIYPPKSLGYTNVTVREGDGYRGWPESAPFDAIIVTAAPDRIPQPLLDQLAPGGRMVIPVGDFFQELKVLTKEKNGRITEKDIIPVRFVPMTGEIEKTPPAPE